MPFLVAAIVLVGLIGAVNLIFSFGVIRRLREHTDILNRMSTSPAVIVAAGATVPPVRATTVDGEPVAADWLVGPMLVGFVSPSCGPCRAKLPSFVAAASGHDGGPERVLAVVIGGTPDDAAPFVAELAPVARVVHESEGGQVQQAFGISGYPAFALVAPGGEVLASGADLDSVALATQRA